MARCAIAAIAGAIVLSFPNAAVAIPKPDRNGDYHRTSHQNWIVVDRDPNGLNCRWSSAMPADWYSPATRFPDTSVSNWQIVRRFKRNTPLTANLSPAGFAILYDRQKKPWLKVSIGSNDQICLVRGNARYIRPIQR